ncbi:unnamed protein product [Notodromas monacha]|uniref:MPN domain-containing protein n=1 Tax=Notodromas monacha TaxID=399045 RepID=A0A7R9BUP6_9CRUS|nr:unnamed protein product [Notodromas monacha]CAG0921094.1 unnamed protein product [Notodromas monacha]
MALTTGLSSDILEPQERMRLLTIMADVQVDGHIAVHKYFRSGVEMMRMAQVYEQEGKMEDAYMLYLRYTILFLEKIREHPGYADVSVVLKQEAKNRLKVAIAKAEETRVKLKDYLQRRYAVHQESLKRAEMERQKREREEEFRRKADKEVLEAKLTALAIARERDFEARKAKREAVSPAKPEPENLPRSAFYHDIAGAVESKANKPAVDRATKPDFRIHDSSRGSGLRTMMVPEAVVGSFLSLAASNTNRNVETCAILSGYLRNDSFVVTDMLVPKQTGTSDSCTTSDEEEIFEYQDQRSLITLGWIHTHPTQTAFLSSVDLHSHCSYQMMLAEAIAIVCAPKHQETRFLMLTPNNGVQYIANCRQTGFHHHEETELFQDCTHVIVQGGLQLTVKDFRA